MPQSKRMENSQSDSDTASRDCDGDIQALYLPISTPDPPFHCFSTCGKGERSTLYSTFMNVVRFMREDADHVLFRRFEDLQLLQLVSLQHKLIDVEKIVHAFDRGSKAPDLEIALLRAGPLLDSYDKALSRYERMQNRRRIPKHTLRTVKGLTMDQTKNSHHLRNELQTEAHLEDLLSIATEAEKGAIHRFIDNTETLQRLFAKDPEKVQKTIWDVEKGKKDNSGSQYPVGTEDKKGPRAQQRYFKYSEKRIKILESILLSFIICALIMVPISVLPLITNRSVRVLLILVCVVLAHPASLLLSGMAHKTNLTIMLTYATILVVFLSDGDKLKN